ncbi:MAG: hypothetical protein DHS20C11_33170 [Lysobacteraceae bacterium]|nr:MAG: hypothetical protein DHS20C11_33170 [Xanthomonadaceae bacterium]
MLALSAIAIWSTLATASDLALSDVLPDSVLGQEAQEIAFDETQSSPALAVDLRSSGTLIYQPATGALTKRIDNPAPAELVVEGDTMRMVSGERSRTISLRKRPEVQVFFDSLRALLTGDEETLQRLFSVEVSGTRSSWTVQLTPSHERLRRLVSSLVILGNERKISSIKTSHGKGETRLMIFTEPQS